MDRATVMIVEDEVIVAEDLRRTLEASGYAVAGHAMEGREAIAMARDLQPDVVLMDIVLRGDMDGIDAARTISETVNTCIIYVSGHSDDSLVDSAAVSGAVGYILKPFQSKQVT